MPSETPKRQTQLSRANSAREPRHVDIAECAMAKIPAGEESRSRCSGHQTIPDVGALKARDWATCNFTKQRAPALGVRRRFKPVVCVEGAEIELLWRVVADELIEIKMIEDIIAFQPSEIHVEIGAALQILLAEEHKWEMVRPTSWSPSMSGKWPIMVVSFGGGATGAAGAGAGATLWAFVAAACPALASNCLFCNGVAEV